MTETLAQKAQLICDQISEKMRGAKVNWSRQAKTFYFTVDDDGSRFSATVQRAASEIEER
jgi:hypothetical protein